MKKTLNDAKRFASVINFTSKYESAQVSNDPLEELLNEFSYLDKTTSNAQTLPNEQTVDKIMTLEQKKCAVILNELEDDLFQLLDEQMKSIEQSRKRLKFYLDDIELNMFD